MSRRRDLPKLNNISHHDPVMPASETRRHNRAYGNSLINLYSLDNRPDYHSGLTSTKLPHLKKINPKPQKMAKSQNKTLKNPKYVPHYMRLRQQDVENKHTAKQKIKDIKKSKPQIIRTPK